MQRKPTVHMKVKMDVAFSPRIANNKSKCSTVFLTTSKRPSREQPGGRLSARKHRYPRHHQRHRERSRLSHSPAALSRRQHPPPAITTARTTATTTAARGIPVAGQQLCLAKQGPHVERRGGVVSLTGGEGHDRRAGKLCYPTLGPSYEKREAITSA